MPPIMTEKQEDSHTTSSSSFLVVENRMAKPLSGVSRHGLATLGPEDAGENHLKLEEPILARGVSKDGLSGLQPPRRTFRKIDSSLQRMLASKVRQIDLALDCIGEYKFKYNGLDIRVQQQNGDHVLVTTTISHNVSLSGETLREIEKMILSTMASGASIEAINEDQVRLCLTSKAERIPPEYLEFERDVQQFVVAALQLREELKI